VKQATLFAIEKLSRHGICDIEIYLNMILVY